MELRRPEAIERDILERERDLAYRVDACESMRADIEETDAFDGGRDDRSRRVLERDASWGRLTNGYRKGTAYRALSREESDRTRVRRELAELRRERAVWSRRVPVGMVEIAALLGYGADAPRQWKRRAILPTPAGSVSGTPYWWRADVLRWALEHGRTRAILPDDEADAYTEENAA